MVETRNKQPRSAFRIPFEIAPGLTIGVKGYNLIIEEKIPTPKKFFTSGEKIEEVTTHTTYQCAVSLCNEFSLSLGWLNRMK